jgi:hypothetical protein
MPLRDALLVVLHLMKGKASNQFSWNLHLFLYYMWLSDCIPIHDLKFTPTRYGPWCHKIIKEINKLEQQDYISRAWSDIMYHDELDDLIAGEFTEPVGYYATEKARTYTESLYNKHAIKSNRINQATLHMEDNIPFLMEAVYHNFPEMIRSK